MNVGDRVLRKRFSAFVERDTVVVIVERRYKNSAIDAVESRVAVGYALAVHVHEARNRNVNNLQLVLLLGYLEAAEIIGRSQMVFIRGIVLVREDDRVAIREPRDVVDVSMRVVAHRASPEPDGRRRTEI